MSVIPGAQFPILGATGTQGALTPKASWRAYIFPQGAYASQDSAGAVITFDSADIASRFVVGNWVQAGTNTANIRQVAAVGGNSINVGSAVTVAENDRIFRIGNTQPTVSGGSATYTVPLSTIFVRDDTAADRITNSMVTTNADGLVRFYAESNIFDVFIQDANQSAQGFIADLLLGSSSAQTFVFGGTQVFANGVSMNEWLRLGQWLQVGTTATFGQTVTFQANAGITGTFTFGSTATFNAGASFGASTTFAGRATFGASVTFSQGVGFTGVVTLSGGVTNAASFGSSVGVLGRFTAVGGSVVASGNSATVVTSQLSFGSGNTLSVGDFTLGASWGTGATITLGFQCRDSIGNFTVSTGSASFGANPDVLLIHKRGHHTASVVTVVSRSYSAAQAQPNVGWAAISSGTATIFFLQGTPAAGQTFSCSYMIMNGGPA